MTSLLPPSTRPSARTRRPASEVGRDLATRRPLVLVATLGGAAAAAATLLVCAGLGVVGWFLTDGGAHGDPSDGLRTGALAWLLGHGSGVHVEGVAVTAVPLGITLVCAWTLWNLGHRVGESVSGHGPDADDVLDGQRDVTVPLAALLFTTGYVVVGVLAASVAATPTTDPSTPRVVLWSVALCLVAALPGIAVGSGRAAIWASLVPTAVRATVRVALRVLVLWTAVSLVAFVAALALDLSTAANVMSQLHTDTGAAVLVVLLSLLLVPNAVVFSSSFLMGPGFTVGTGTLVSPGAVVLGPLPMFPMLAALPDDGAQPGWTSWLLVLAPLTAVLAAVLAQRAWPTTRWDEAAVRGCAGGVLAGVVLGVVSGLAGGAVGPGRMRDVAPQALDTTLHAVAAFGIGGLLGALAMTWWQRRTMPVDIDLEP